MGLRLEDVENMQLESEKVYYDSRINPKTNLIKSGAIEEEVDFLVQHGYSGNWWGERVELNAMTSELFISWLEEKLDNAGVEKVVPSEKELKKWYEQAKKQAILEDKIEKQKKEVQEMNIEIPKDLTGKIKERLKDSMMPWDSQIYFMIREEENEQ